MKKDIHPDYHDITVVFTDGTEIQTRSTYGKAGDRIQLDVDPKTHPAWTGKHRLVDRGGQLAKFNKRFAGIGGDDAKQDIKPAKKEEKIKMTGKVKAKK